MQKRKFDELISYFNRKVADMDIDINYKMELLGMITALGYAHEKETEDRKKGMWIPLQLSMANPPYQCSCCFQNAPMIETGCLMNRHLEALLTDFCPNCGAEMAEGEGCLNT